MSETVDVPDRLRFYWWGAREAGYASGPPGRQLLTNSRYVKSGGLVKGKRFSVWLGCQQTADELAKCAVVFLMHARTLRRAVVFDVRPNRRGCRITCIVGIDDADNPGHHRLRKGGDENPATNKCRNASDH